jgi:Beta protein
MMNTRHIVILKSKEGEFEALENLDELTVRRVRPLFEVGRLTDAILKHKYITSSQTPTITHLDRVLGQIGVVWAGRSAMVDGYQWSPNARTENGDHVIAHMVFRLRELGVRVIPVVGYDRWGDAEYRLGLQGIPSPDDGHYCLRLDSSAIEDVAEPEHFDSVIQSMVDDLDLNPAHCSVLLDFADISMSVMSVEKIVAKAIALIIQLEKFEFSHYVIAGCSLPPTINLAVSKHDTTGSVARKEMLAWQTLRLEFPNTTIVSGDYGVRGPTTTEAPNKYINGKIRHTVKKQIFVVRGHPFNADHNYSQMYDLSSKIIGSPHFLGEDFSWGDRQILLGSRGVGSLGSTRWIAIDTNHHLTFVVQEVEEFEMILAAKVTA